MFQIVNSKGNWPTSSKQDHALSSKILWLQIINRQIWWSQVLDWLFLNKSSEKKFFNNWMKSFVKLKLRIKRIFILPKSGFRTHLLLSIPWKSWYPIKANTDRQNNVRTTASFRAWIECSSAWTMERKPGTIDIVLRTLRTLNARRAVRPEDPPWGPLCDDAKAWSMSVVALVALVG